MLIAPETDHVDLSASAFLGAQGVNDGKTKGELASMAAPLRRGCAAVSSQLSRKLNKQTDLSTVEKSFSIENSLAREIGLCHDAILFGASAGHASKIRLRRRRLLL